VSGAAYRRSRRALALAGLATLAGRAWRAGAERRIAGVAAGLGAAAIWGGMYVASKYVLHYVPPLTLVLCRLAIGTAALGLLMAATRAPLVRRPDLPLMALLGFVGLFVSMVAQFAGTSLSTAAGGALITSATPAFMLLFGWPLLGERPTWLRVGSLALATAGVAIVALDPAAAREFGADAAAGGPLAGAPGAPGVPDRVVAGNVLLVVAAITWALYSVLARIANRRYPVLVTTCYATGFGALFTGSLVPLELAAQPLAQPLPPLAWLGVLYLGLVSTAGAFYLWNKSIELLGVGVPSILFFAQPVVGGALGALLLGERLGVSFYLGGALIALAVALTAREA
jgi:drug/metabolite transporter (DMT)-like permease